MAEAEDTGAEKKGRPKAKAKAKAVAITSSNEVTAATAEDKPPEVTKDDSVKAEGEAVVETNNAMAEPDNAQAAEMQENAGADTEEQTRAELEKVDLPEDYNVQELGVTQLAADITATSSFVDTSFLDTLHAIAAETSDYSRRSLESKYSFVAKLSGATTFESIIQITAEHTKTTCAALIAYLTKMTALRANLANEFFKPVETAFARFQNGKE
jgi:hypothetical protein